MPDVIQRHLSFESTLTGIMSGSILGAHMAWYDFGILYLLKAYCVVRFKDPVCLESTLPGMISKCQPEESSCEVQTHSMFSVLVQGANLRNENCFFSI